MSDIKHVLTYGEDEEAAELNAKLVVRNHMKHHQKGKGYLIYVGLFEKDSGLGREGRMAIQQTLQVSTSLYPTDDKRGLDLVNSMIEDNGGIFDECMECIRSYIEEYTNEELFDPRIEVNGIHNLYLFRHYCYTASGLHQDPSFAELYDFKGNAIWYPDQLVPLLNPSWAALRYLDEGDDPYWGEHIWNKPLWAVPFQCIFEQP